MRCKKILWYLIQFTWGLPQNILGFISFLFVKLINKDSFVKVYKGTWSTHVPGYWGGLSLGCFIFLDNNIHEAFDDQCINHEHGHSIQSAILGPMYLFAIGIPSLIWTQVYKHTNKSYYWFYTEAWANSLGGVKK